jgi:excisionase family DNA binding protein
MEPLVKFGKWTIKSLAMRATAMSIREKYMKVRDAAEFLGVAPNTVRAWGAAGKLPEFRSPANGYRLYKREDLEKFLRQIERTITSVQKRKK